MSDELAMKTIAERLGPVQAGLRSDLEVTRHLFRGQPQYVVRDPLTFQTHQFSQQDYEILVTLDSSQSLQDVFRYLVDQQRLSEDQEESFYQFVLMLHRLNYLILPLSDGKVLYERFASRQRTARWRQISGFLFLRVPLINPDAFLDRTADLVRPLFTRKAFLMWLVMMATAAALLTRRWSAFSDPVHSIFANDTLLFIWCALIGLKVVHEFGHAYACKIFGGKVPEMGAFLIAFTPCAYMDASAAWGFSKTRHRVIVSLAGMYFESFATFLALLVWCFTDDPRISSYAHHIVVLSSIVTVGFNINPLMRYDGYYVMSDLVGIPNLRQRSIEQVQSVLKRWFLGIDVSDEGTTLRERLLLLTYGSLASIYKVMLVLAICTMIAMKFYIVGVFLAAFFLFGVVSSLLRRSLGYLWRSQETEPVRARAVLVSLVLILLVPAAVATIPIPGRVVVSGIVQTEDDNTVFAEVGGFLSPHYLPVGSQAKPGDIICSLSNTALDSDVLQTESDAEVARAEFALGVLNSPHQAAAARLRLVHAEQRLDEKRRDRDQLVVRAPVAGLVIRNLEGRDLGRFIEKGEAIATIANGPWTVRCLATAEQIADARPTVGEDVRVRILLDSVHEIDGTIQEVGVQGARTVFSPVLTQLGGGDIAADPRTLASIRPMFEIEIRLHEPQHVPLYHDAQAVVLFRGDSRTYGAFAYRRFQQFLNRLRMH